MPANAFETDVGRFWDIVGTRDYMRARYFLADTLRGSGTLDGVTEALDHLQDMLRLCPDIYKMEGVACYLIPPLMLQLDQDQECYDFIKSYATYAMASYYEWEIKDLPFLMVQDANVLDDYFDWCIEYPEFLHVSTLVLLIIKLVVDIINMMRVRKVSSNDGRLPPELWKHVEFQVVRSPISRQWVRKLDQDLMDVLRELETQVGYHLETIRCEHFVGRLLDPNKDLASFSLSTFYLNMGLYLAIAYAAWWQHEGVLELLESAKSFIAEREEEKMADILKDRKRLYPDMPRAWLLKDLIGNRLWLHFGQAVDDAMGLSEIRPPERRATSRVMSRIFRHD